MDGFIKNEPILGFEKVLSLSSFLDFKLSFGNTADLSVTIAFTQAYIISSLF